MTGTGDRRLADVVRAARSRLAEAGLADAAIETRMLIGGLLGLDATEMFTGGDRILSESEVAKIDAALERRLKREPVHRILGARDFHGLHLTLSPQTLEPRPDTEVLVEAVLPHAWRIAAGEGRVDILDLGVGEPPQDQVHLAHAPMPRPEQKLPAPRVQLGGGCVRCGHDGPCPFPKPRI